MEDLANQSKKKRIMYWRCQQTHIVKTWFDEYLDVNRKMSSMRLRTIYESKSCSRFWHWSRAFNGRGITFIESFADLQGMYSHLFKWYFVSKLVMTYFEKKLWSRKHFASSRLNFKNRIHKGWTFNDAVFWCMIP